MNGSQYATNLMDVTGYISRKQNGTIGYYDRDGHGDIVNIYGADGTTKLASYEYDAFGNQKSSSGAWYSSNPIRDCGEYYDSESGLIYLRARYYDSENGRFMTEDPIKDGLNWHSYCGGNPVMFVDPSGLIGIKPDGSIYMDENDTETDRELLQLKINYANAKTEKERNDIAQEAEYIRKTTTEPYKVLAQYTLESYMIPDLTYEINKIMQDNEKSFEAHKRDYIWFKNKVRTGALIDVKNSNVNFERNSYSYHIIYNGQVMRADAPGNIMYGYLGKVAKFSDAELLYGAGIYQIYEDSGRKISTAIKNTHRLFNNYGDNNGDPEQIMMGINLYKNKNGGGAW